MYLTENTKGQETGTLTSEGNRPLNIYIMFVTVVVVLNAGLNS